MTVPGPGRRLRFTFDGVSLEAIAGQSVAAALWAAGFRALARAPRSGAPRGPFCAMGVCQDCLLLVDGVAVESCRVAVREGLVVERPERPA
ncbi:2Fe-2S iron-sulfur cluster binding domain-containing protein [Tistlia consotensis]|uniref:2Fe-2S iron-sulfur cluster binding domain-containing protein n=1 Tax=Tistlia consotensis USBA 355 TaxID=560819 RepID=A0A1Y6C653_9PROT|nr:(2Fe-2S)-binding protein [Tistlia consotensis]SMF38874.1 2Fe-2S iron-sulfur cluster binding domain-containing protein [Tistlia consotensis USBA 355]SNR36760.1 2Fe-2S iron-sulfur cluster binding domain-containing protein [Tistlia consotensis]